jgi:hypothetical protein
MSVTIQSFNFNAAIANPTRVVAQSLILDRFNLSATHRSVIPRICDISQFVFPSISHTKTAVSLSDKDSRSSIILPAPN